MFALSLKFASPPNISSLRSFGLLIVNCNVSLVYSPWQRLVYVTLCRSIDGVSASQRILPHEKQAGQPDHIIMAMMKALIQRMGFFCKHFRFSKINRFNLFYLTAIVKSMARNKEKTPSYRASIRSSTNHLMQFPPAYSSKNRYRSLPCIMQI